MIQAANLALRFLLEMAGLFAVGYWGFTLPAPLVLKMMIGLGCPLTLAVLWAVFRVPGAQEALVPVIGPVRLLLELFVFGAAVAATSASGHPRLALLFAAVLCLHYGIDYERVWNLGRGTPGAT